MHTHRIYRIHSAFWVYVYVPWAAVWSCPRCGCFSLWQKTNKEGLIEKSCSAVQTEWRTPDEAQALSLWDIPVTIALLQTSALLCWKQLCINITTKPHLWPQLWYQRTNCHEGKRHPGKNTYSYYHIQSVHIHTHSHIHIYIAKELLEHWGKQFQEGKEHLFSTHTNNLEANFNHRNICMNSVVSEKTQTK